MIWIDTFWFRALECLTICFYATAFGRYQGPVSSKVVRRIFVFTITYIRFTKFIRRKLFGETGPRRMFSPCHFYTLCLLASGIFQFSALLYLFDSISMLFISLEDGWMDTWMDGWFGALCPFQQYFSHIRMHQTFRTMYQDDGRVNMFSLGKNLATVRPETHLIRSRER